MAGKKQTLKFPLEIKVQLNFQVYHHHWIKLRQELVDK